MKKTFLSIALLLILAGCGTAIKHSVAPEYAQISPKRVVVLPIVWEQQAAPEAGDISLLFRKMSAERLGLLNYSAVPLDEVDKAGAGKPDWFAGKSADEIAASLKADSVLYIFMKEWDSDSLAPYRSLKIAAVFELHSAAGKVLWKAEYSTREADLRLDSRQLELAVLKVYEPRIQRFVDAVFTTLPPAKRARKTYFRCHRIAGCEKLKIRYRLLKKLQMRESKRGVRRTLFVRRNDEILTKAWGFSAA
jgi:hypothetical protein